MYAIGIEAISVIYTHNIDLNQIIISPKAYQIQNLHIQNPNLNQII